MSITYTNRKGQTYTLYQGQTKTGKPRYYFGREGQSHGELVMEIPVGFTISESVNGVVSLAKDRPALIQPEEVAEVQQAMTQHPKGSKYRLATKHHMIEIYEQAGPDLDALVSQLQQRGWSDPDLASRLKVDEERYAQYTPVLRFILTDPKQRWFEALRMCYRSSIDGWLELSNTGPGPVAELARALIPTLLHRCLRVTLW